LSASTSERLTQGLLGHGTALDLVLEALVQARVLERDRRLRREDPHHLGACRRERVMGEAVLQREDALGAALLHDRHGEDRASVPGGDVAVGREAFVASRIVEHDVLSGPAHVAHDRR
jgi:hypothetical protein